MFTERGDCLRADSKKQMIEHFKKLFKRTLTKQLDGVGVVEVILILVIVIGLVLIFHDQISDIIDNAFDSITGDTETIIGG